MLPTENLLTRVYGIEAARARLFVTALREGCLVYEITTPARLAAFLATVGHESGRLAYTREIWGPTPAQERYEGRADLGNTERGDGERFKGRGLIQVTGRTNYAEARDTLRQRFGGVPDFEAEPEELEAPRWAALSAGAFWDRRALNVLADGRDFLRLSIRVNGKNKQGLPNGWPDRLQLWDAAKRALQN